MAGEINCIQYHVLMKPNPEENREKRPVKIEVRHRRTGEPLPKGAVKITKAEWDETHRKLLEEFPPFPTRVIWPE